MRKNIGLKINATFLHLEGRTLSENFYFRVSVSSVYQMAVCMWEHIKKKAAVFRLILNDVNGNRIRWVCKATVRLHHVNPAFFTIIGNGYLSNNGQIAVCGSPGMDVV
ncbi:hypothetical protein Ga0466249_005093 [Sporomusaceae bacterium BoRhaA]|nr:hypothetical protein [Pelorhabdus rhamnosifermentans]